MDSLSLLGTTSLFIGVESQSWSLADFQAAAQAAKALGVSTLLVKIADGTNVWYSNIGGIGSWRAALDAVEAQGVKAVPYTYCYGNKFGAIDVEIDIVKQALATAGIVIADLEAEYNGQAGWASTVANALKGKQGQFGVVTWADPNLQDWQGVIAALRPCVDFWMPQVYTDFLASVYKTQFAGLPLVPVFNLGTDDGPNNLLGNVNAAPSGPISFWEYQAAIGSWAATIKSITASQGGTDMLQITDPFAARHFKETSATSWLCNDTGLTVVSGILNCYRKTQGAFRLPLTSEIYNVIPGGSFQVFEAGVLVWDPQHKLDDPGQGDVYAMHLNKDTPGLRKLMAFAGITAPAVTTEQLASAVTAVKAAETNLAVALSDLEPAHS